MPLRGKDKKKGGEKERKGGERKRGGGGGGDMATLFGLGSVPGEAVGLEQACWGLHNCDS